jgi:hypothetical protein
MRNTQRECEQCGEHRDDVQDRPDGCAECYSCWRAALAHGHLHGLHTDGSGDPADAELDHCPECPPMHERVRRAALRERDSDD